MLAAEAAFAAMLKEDASAEVLKAYKDGVDASWIRADMEPARNMHANFAKGFVSGIVNTGIQYAFGPGEQKTYGDDYAHIHKTAGYTPQPWAREPIPYDGTYLIDKLTDVYNSGTTHEEQQPAHLKILDTEVCATTCLEEYGNPCTKFCPAAVYNMRENEESGRLEMEVDFANCVHCKTCDIRDPYQIITWMPPEGGNGPEYDQM
jgi:electron-transferring-flavoprotein dehydrogenase